MNAAISPISGRLLFFARFFAAFFALILFCLSSVAYPEGPPVELRVIDSTGIAPVAGGNIALARDAAIEDALRKAIEQAVGSFISTETIVENYQVLSDNILTRSEGYVKGYSVLSEAPSGAMYQAVVRATIALGTLKNDLDAIGLLYARVEKPRVLFMIAEQAGVDREARFWWSGAVVDLSATEISLKEIFIKKGFNVVDISATTQEIGVAGALRVPDISNEGARFVAKKLNAEIVVKGRSLATEGPRTPGSTIAPYIADVAADAIRVDTGEVLASAKGHGVARHISAATGGMEALSRASAELAEGLVPQILAKWTSSGMVRLTITGITDYNKVQGLKDMIKRRVRGVSAVYQRRFEDGVAVFEIEAKASASAIADSISSLPGSVIKVTSTTQNAIEAQYDAQ